MHCTKLNLSYHALNLRVTKRHMNTNTSTASTASAIAVISNVYTQGLFTVQYKGYMVIVVSFMYRTASPVGRCSMQFVSYPLN